MKRDKEMFLKNKNLKRNNFQALKIKKKITKQVFSFRIDA